MDEEKKERVRILTNNRQARFYKNNQSKCICNKILKHTRETGGVPTITSLKKYPDILTMDAIYKEFNHYLNNEINPDIKYKKKEKFLKRINLILA